MKNNEPIIIPMTEAGERCFNRIRAVVEMQLCRAKTAVADYVSQYLPTAEIAYGRNSTDKKEYHAVVELPGGKSERIAYIYKTKEIYLERT